MDSAEESALEDTDPNSLLTSALVEMSHEQQEVQKNLEQHGHLTATAVEGDSSFQLPPEVQDEGSHSIPELVRRILQGQAVLSREDQVEENKTHGDTRSRGSTGTRRNKRDAAGESSGLCSGER